MTKNILDKNSLFIITTAVVLLAGVSFYLGFLVGEEEIARRAIEEMIQEEERIEEQKEELDALKEERKQTSPTQVDPQTQIDELRELREKTKVEE